MPPQQRRSMPGHTPSGTRPRKSGSCAETAQWKIRQLIHCELKVDGSGNSRQVSSETHHASPTPASARNHRSEPLLQRAASEIRTPRDFTRTTDPITTMLSPWNCSPGIGLPDRSPRSRKIRTWGRSCATVHVAQINREIVRGAQTRVQRSWMSAIRKACTRSWTPAPVVSRSRLSMRSTTRSRARTVFRLTPKS